VDRDVFVARRWGLRASARTALQLSETRNTPPRTPRARDAPACASVITIRIVIHSWRLLIAGRGMQAVSCGGCVNHAPSNPPAIDARQSADAFASRSFDDATKFHSRSAAHPACPRPRTSRALPPSASPHTDAGRIAMVASLTTCPSISAEPSTTYRHSSSASGAVITVSRSVVSTSWQIPPGNLTGDVWP